MGNCLQLTWIWRTKEGMEPFQRNGRREVSLTQQKLSVSRMPSTVLSTGDISVNKTDRNPYFHGALDPGGRRRIRNLINEKTA